MTVIEKDTCALERKIQSRLTIGGQGAESFDSINWFTKKNFLSIRDLNEYKIKEK